MSTEVANESGYSLDETEFADLARFVLDEMHVHPQAELEVHFVDVEMITELNERWMDSEGPTDVLAFPMDELRPGSVEEPSVEGILGSVVLCPQVAVDQARTAGHSAEEEMLLLTTHGILHLLGYDHAEPEEEKEMFGLQRRLLLTFLAARPGASAEAASADTATGAAADTATGTAAPGGPAADSLDSDSPDPGRPDPGHPAPGSAPHA